MTYTLLLCRQNGSLEQKRGEESEERDRQHTALSRFQVCFSDQTHTQTHSLTHTSFIHFCTRWVWVLNATPWPLTPEEKSCTHCIGWDLVQVWTAAEFLVQARIQSPDSPACSEALLLCRHDGSLEEKRGEESEKSESRHYVSPGFKVCTSDETALHTHLFWQ